MILAPKYTLAALLLVVGPLIASAARIPGHNSNSTAGIPTNWTALLPAIEQRLNISLQALLPDLLSVVNNSLNLNVSSSSWLSGHRNQSVAHGNWSVVSPSVWNVSHVLNGSHVVHHNASGHPLWAGINNNSTNNASAIWQPAAQNSFQSLWNWLSNNGHRNASHQQPSWLVRNQSAGAWPVQHPRPQNWTAVWANSSAV